VTICPVCGNEVGDLAGHLVARAGRSDGQHIMWLNRNVTKKAVDAEELARLLADPAIGSDRVRR
jgi:hypothetical protein